MGFMAHIICLLLSCLPVTELISGEMSQPSTAVIPIDITESYPINLIKPERIFGDVAVGV